LLLVNEMFKQHFKLARFIVSEPIPIKNIETNILSRKEKVRLVKKHLYRLPHGKKQIFATEKTVAHPEPRQAIKRELRQAHSIGSTSDGLSIYLYYAKPDSSVMNEIGRLRELTFRHVGEGTGMKRDLDLFDKYYHHIVLWDNEELEIVGAYRIGHGREIMSRFGEQGFYTNTLFEYTSAFQPQLMKGIELGRSFVQPRYWGSRALDYLWQGVGAYLYENPDVKYMFGPVSISNSYPQKARELIYQYYSTYFGSGKNLVASRSPFAPMVSKADDSRNIFATLDRKSAFIELKKQLSFLDVSVPTLYKQYSELCDDDGVQFLDFGVDHAFENCLDGFIVVTVDKIKAAKQKRYIDIHAQNDNMNRTSAA
jgi:hypothetical protein